MGQIVVIHRLFSEALEMHLRLMYVSIFQRPQTYPGAPSAYKPSYHVRGLVLGLREEWSCRGEVSFVSAFQVIERNSSLKFWEIVLYNI